MSKTILNSLDAFHRVHRRILNVAIRNAPPPILTLLVHRDCCLCSTGLCQCAHNFMAHCSSQARNYAEALHWYDYSLSFFKAGQLDPNLAKLQRNRVSCFLQLKQLEKVKQDRPSQPRRQVFPSSLCCQLFIGFMCSVFIRPKMRLKKHSALIPTAFLPTSVSIRSQCWRTTWREVSGGYLLEKYSYLTFISCECVYNSLSLP